MRIRIDAVDLPGLTHPGSADGVVPAHGNVHVAVQRRDRPAELLDPQPGDAPSATWTLECTARTSPEGVEVQGPYVQDRLGRRFVYLSWGTVDAAGLFTMFRRAKLMLDVVPADVLAAARPRRAAGRAAGPDRRTGRTPVRAGRAPADRLDRRTRGLGLSFGSCRRRGGRRPQPVSPCTRSHSVPPSRYS